MNQTATRIKNSAKELFAIHGFDRVSVRQICSHAEVSSNSVNYYFDSKDNLLKSIIDEFGDNLQLSLDTLLEANLRSKEDFISRFEMLLKVLLENFLKEQELISIIFDELPRSMMNDTVLPTNFTNLLYRLSDFFTKARKLGYLHKKADPANLAGIVLDRLSIQVRYAKPLEKLTKHSISIKKVRDKWLKDNTYILLFGVLGSD